MRDEDNADGSRRMERYAAGRIEPQNLLDVKEALSRRGLGVEFAERLNAAIETVAMADRTPQRLSSSEILAGIPVQPEQLAPYIQISRADKAGITRACWRTQVHLIKRAHKLTGARETITQRHIPLNPSWLRLVTDLPAKHSVRLLARWASPDYAPIVKE